jgi:large subunit ribosomal protein L23
MEKTAQDIIVRPIITERSMAGIPNKKYTFRVAMDANKVQIAQAVETLFGVKVAKVNTLHVRGRAKRVGKFSGYAPNWKKAIVSLKPDSKSIEFFEGMA